MSREYQREPRHFSDGKPVIVKLPGLVLNEDREGKPVGIQRHIGRHPTAVFGNSVGDFQMMEWTTSENVLRYGLIMDPSGFPG